MADYAARMSALQDVPASPTFLEKLMMTWPARMGKAALDAVMLPGDVFAGRAQPGTDDYYDRAAELAGMVLSGPAGAPAGVIGSGLTRRARNIDDLRTALAKEHPDVDFHVSQPGYVAIDKIVVPEAERGKGIGTQFVRDVLDYSDVRGLNTALTPDSAFGGNKRQLEAWYRSLGFGPNKGRNKDFSISESMVRPVPRDMTVYRGESAHNRGGNFFSVDDEFAQQFTQSGRAEEVMKRAVARSEIYDPPTSVYAGDEAAVEAAIAEAKRLGKKAVRLSEGAGEPDSIFVFNKTVLNK